MLSFKNALVALCLLTAVAGAQTIITNSYSGAFVDISATGTSVGTVSDDSEHNIVTTIGNALFPAGNVREIDSAFAELVRKGCNALVVGASSLLASRRVQIATLAAIQRLPAIYYTRQSVEVGGLMSYGADITSAIYQAGTYVGRILKGENPADLPVMQSAKFEFVVNLQTARSLGLTVPPTLLALADEVIE